MTVEEARKALLEINISYGLLSPKEKEIRLEEYKKKKQEIAKALTSSIFEEKERKIK